MPNPTGNNFHEEDRLREIVDYLHENGLSKELQLPEIAVMGDTSSGKSSLLSAISGVQFPASSDITTRCPTRLRMEKSKDGRTSARIEILCNSEFTFDPVILEGPDAFTKISEEISKAQKFILESRKTEVSEDVIQITLTDPACSDLTLIDLPGIVRTSGKGESESLGREIQVLIDKYLRNERCIILAVVPANVDFHNSQILADAKKVDPETVRTFPVINKPDLIDHGAEAGVEDLLLGKRTDFSLGFHIVKCRGQKALLDGTSIASGLKDEISFFRSTEPWKSISDRSVIGVPNLVAKLADLQIEMLKKEVPNILQDMRKKRVEIEKDLEAAGIDLSSEHTRRSEFSKISHMLERKIGDVVRGSDLNLSSVYNFRSSVESKYNEFQTTLSVSELCKFRNANNVKNPLEADGENMGVDSPNEGTADVSDKRAWLLDLILRSRRHEVPVFLSNEVFTAIIGGLIEKDWKPTALKLIEEIFREISEQMVVLIKLITRGSPPNVTERFQRLVNEIMKDLEEELIRTVLKIFKAESLQPYTQNHYLFESIQKKKMNKLLGQIRDAVNEKNEIKFEAVEGILKANQNMSCEEHMVTEMEYALEAYGKVAFKRVIDHIPMECEAKISDFLPRVHEKLSNFTDVDLTALFSESKSAVMKRRNLQEKLKQFQKAEEAVQRILGF
jgi:GTPase SAR1 family protein